MNTDQLTIAPPQRRISTLSTYLQSDLTVPSNPPTAPWDDDNDEKIVQISNSPQKRGSLFDIITSNIHLKHEEEEEERDEHGWCKQKYRLFDEESYEMAIMREKREKLKIKKTTNLPLEGKIIDGEIQFEDDGNEDEEPDENLEEGQFLPEADFGKFPDEYLGKPIEELDKRIKEATFLVIVKRFSNKIIFRYSASKSFYIFSPWNSLRKFLILLTTNQFFDFFIMAAILANCVFLALPGEYFPSDYIFLSIYTSELLMRWVCRGVILNSYAFLRDPWCWLDFTVVMLAYIMMVVQAVQSNSTVNINALRAFRVFRVLRTITIIPGLKPIISALLKSMRMLAEVLILMSFFMCVFGLIATQNYMGDLRHKCVYEVDWSQMGNSSIIYDNDTINAFYVSWIKNSSHWYSDGNGNYLTCGNDTGSGRCSAYDNSLVCTGDVGPNPLNGFYNFDNFGWTLLGILQMITLDNFDNLYDLIHRTSGPWNILYFIILVFFGSFYLVNLMLSVVVLSFEEEAERDEKERQRELDDKKTTGAAKKAKKKKKKDKDYTFDPKNLKMKPRKKKKKDKPNVKDQQTQPIVEEEKERMISSNNSEYGGSIPSQPPPKSLLERKKSLFQTSKKQDSKESLISKGSTNTISLHMSGSNNNNNNDTLTEIEETSASDATRSNLPKKKPFLRTETQTTLESIITEGETSLVTETQGAEDSESEKGNETETVKKKNDEPLFVTLGDVQYEDRNCGCCGQCCCRHYVHLVRFQHYVYVICMDPFFELLIFVTIIFNTLVMAMERYPSDDLYDEFLLNANIVCSSIFITEAVLKIIAIPKSYWLNPWSVFDFIIVVATILDFALTDINGLSLLRALRLFRVFKLAQAWPALRVLLNVIFSAIISVANITLVLFIIMFIFAVIGQQLYSGMYTADVFGSQEAIPRFNFNDFLPSIMAIFSILCGNWIQDLQNCFLATASLGCLAVYIPSLILGNFMVLNLFLALLLSYFGSDTIRNSTGDEDTKVVIAVVKIKDFILKCLKIKSDDDDSETKVLDEKQNNDENEEVLKNEGGHLPSQARRPSILSRRSGMSHSRLSVRIAENDNTIITEPKKEFHSFLDVISLSNEQEEDASQVKKTGQPSSLGRRGSKADTAVTSLPDTSEAFKEDEDEDDPDNLHSCCCDRCYDCCQPERCCACCYPTLLPESCWTKFRRLVAQIVCHKGFEYTILVFIFCSSISLCFDDIYIDDNEPLSKALEVMNLFFAAVFGLEMLSKWIALGFKEYFTSFWTLLDFFIVSVSFVDITITYGFPNSVQIGALKALRTLRAFRPLRSISRWEGMRIVVNALIHAVPAIIHVFSVCLIFWLVFSIMGVQFFKGTFYKCIDSNGNRLSSSIVPNKTACESYNQTQVSWTNSQYNFDNVGSAFLALFQIATFEGFGTVMPDAVDAVGIDKQPEQNYQIAYYLYFVAFIIVCSFFALNLFIGVIIDNFNSLKKKYEGNYLDAFLTPSQRHYYNTLRKMGKKKPEKIIHRPENEFFGFFYDVSCSTKFDLAIVGVIFVNMIVMMVEYYKEPDTLSTAMDIINIAFTTVFTLEAVVKLIGLRFHYFRQAWNVFDFLIVLLSILGIILGDALTSVIVKPTLLRIFRVFRIAKVLRLIKAARGIRKLLFALIVSLPALVNIGALLVLIVFIYSIIGLNLFANVAHTSVFDEIVNFETFAHSFLLMFRLITGAGWGDVLSALIVQPPDCNYAWFERYGKNITISGGNCGISWAAIIFMTTYIFISFLIIINMYIAVILENFTQAHEEEEIGITTDDFDMFYNIWALYDPLATQYIPYEKLSDLIAAVEEPLGLPKPNMISIISFDLPIFEGERVHCLDVLNALTRNVVGEVEISKEFRQLQKKTEKRFNKAFPTRKKQVIISTTMRRKKEDIASKTLQRAWRRHKAQLAFRKMADTTQGASKDRPQVDLSKFAKGPSGQMFGSQLSVRFKQQQQQQQQRQQTPKKKTKPTIPTISPPSFVKMFSRNKVSANPSV